MSHYKQAHLQLIADRAAARKVDNTRHKCFISYHAADNDEVESFLDTYGSEFIARTIGVTKEDDFIDSSDTEYIMDRIRTKYLGDSTVTVVLIGRCTWSRRFVDWEVYSSLRNSKHSTVNGLLAINLPSIGKSGTLPARVNDNIQRDSNNNDMGYARWYVYPDAKQTLRRWIDDAYIARTARLNRLDNSRSRRINSSPCP